MDTVVVAIDVTAAVDVDVDVAIDVANDMRKGCNEEVFSRNWIGKH